MKRNNVHFVLVLLTLVVILIWSTVEMLHEDSEKEPYMISVIVSDSNDAHWVAMRDGLEQAAQNNNVILNYVSTSKFESIEDEFAVINRELERGVDGLILQLVDAGADSEILSQIASRTALMLIETDVNPQELYAYTGPDNTELGFALTELITDDFGTSIAGKRVGILVGEPDRLAILQRLEGVRKGLEQSGAEIVWEITGSAESVRLKLDTRQTIDKADILFALDNRETELAVDYLSGLSAAGRAGTHLYGIGNSEKVVYYLDKGLIEYLVVPNEFNMGYQSIEALAEQLEYRGQRAKSEKVEYRTVNRTSLYDEENQKLLFPIVQ